MTQEGFIMQKCSVQLHTDEFSCCTVYGPVSGLMQLLIMEPSFDFQHVYTPGLSVEQEMEMSAIVSIVNCNKFRKLRLVYSLNEEMCSREWWIFRTVYRVNVFFRFSGDSSFKPIGLQAKIREQTRHTEV